ncbi:hypothetical protein E1B28_006289 [Marasmius oreades]|uniref:Uncharacterized protein n=1 Tax=Marasmius oreades TaxID=181124 RepID=A0A9P7UW37_9AGAR|nr:uncharacterized protein E1B28_006289 [Marasmius oreades]KAG7095551.1 hypothetical protein E1B28_006289 [Marasmius oreades]
MFQRKVFPLSFPSCLGSNKALESAAFPDGLPEALEASVALQLLSEGHSSDSDHATGCACPQNGDCNCCIPRKSAPRRRKKESSGPKAHPHSGANTPPNNTAVSHPSHTALTRIAELRPVLPKPASTRRHDYADGPVHEPSSGQHHSHAARHHESSLYSPYGRAYDYTHTHPHHDFIGDAPALSTRDVMSYNSFSSATSSPSPVGRLDESSGRVVPSPSNNIAPDSGNISAWYSTQSPAGAGDIIASLCKCGEECGCIGCAVHLPTNQSNPHHTCFFNSDGTCASCLNCLVLTAPPDIPPNTALSIYQDQDSRGVDEWVRQVNPSFPPSSPSFDLGGYPELGIGSDMYLPSSMAGCRCPPGLCQCDSRSGCGCVRESQGFAVSGERASRCRHGGTTPPAFDEGTLGVPEFYSHFNQSMEGIPMGGQTIQFRSRSGSSSSGSSEFSFSSDKVMLGTPSPHEGPPQHYF